MVKKAKAKAAPKAPSIKFDETRSYGVICGAFEKAKYQQGSEYFTAQGEHLPELSMKGISEETIHGPKDVEVPEVQPVNNTQNAIQGEVNLQNWVDGKEQHMWPHIQVAVKSATGVHPTNKAHALELLNTHGVVTDGNDMDNANG